MNRLYLYIILLLLLPVTVEPQENKETVHSNALLRELVLKLYSINEQNESIEAIRKKGPSIVPELINLSKDHDNNVRVGAILAIGLFPQDAKGAIPVLIDALKEKDEAIIMVAADTLREIGPEAAPAVPQLTSIIKDRRFISSRSNVIFNAVAALGQIGKAAESAIPALEKISNDRQLSSATQAEAFITINLIGTENADPKVRADAARDLGWVGGRSGIIKILNRLLNDPDVSVRKAADEALINISILALLDKVQGKDTNERLGALNELGNIGQAAEWAELIISHCLKDTDEKIRSAAADALKKIKGE